MADLRAASAKILRYAQATAGPVATAVAQFILSLQILHALPSADFGRFAFLLVAAQFSAGLWSALFCAPVPVLWAQTEGDSREALRRCLFATNLIIALISLVLFWGIAVTLGAGGWASLFFAGFAATGLLRWFARAYAYAEGTPGRTTASDMIYSAALFAGIGVIQFAPSGGLALPFAALFAATVVSFLPFGRHHLKGQFLDISLKAVAGYGDIWKRHSGWSLLGVLTTEATVNAHTYILTFLAGPAAFAPVAASALTIRPVGVASNALTEFERPQIARHLAADDHVAAHRSTRFFLVILVLGWLASAAAAVVLFALDPYLLFPKDYTRDVLVLGTVLWMTVALLRQLRTPDSVLLQAAGCFRALAGASFASAVVSVIAVTACLLLGGPVWSIAGLAAGEIVCGACLWWQARAYKRRTPAPPSPPLPVQS